MAAAQLATDRIAWDAPAMPAFRGTAQAAALSLLLHGLAVAAIIGMVLQPEAPKGEAIFAVELVPAATAAAAGAAQPVPAPEAGPPAQPAMAAAVPEPQPEQIARAAPEIMPLPSPEAEAEAVPAPLPEWKPKPAPPPPAPTAAKVKPVTPPAETPPAPARAGGIAAPPAEPVQATAQPAGQQGAEQQRAAVTAGSSDEPPVVTEPRFRVPPRPPEYPPRARAMEQQGVSVVRALVDTDGTSREIRLWQSSGFDALDRAALIAVRGWRFEVARRGDQPVLAWVEIPIRFEIR